MENKSIQSLMDNVKNYQKAYQDHVAELAELEIKMTLMGTPFYAVPQYPEQIRKEKNLAVAAERSKVALLVRVFEELLLGDGFDGGDLQEIIELATKGE